MRPPRGWKRLAWPAKATRCAHSRCVPRTIEATSSGRSRRPRRRCPPKRRRPMQIRTRLPPRMRTTSPLRPPPAMLRLPKHATFARGHATTLPRRWPSRSRRPRRVVPQRFPPSPLRCPLRSQPSRRRKTPSSFQDSKTASPPGALPPNGLQSLRPTRARRRKVPSPLPSRSNTARQEQHPTTSPPSCRSRSEGSKSARPRRRAGPSRSRRAPRRA